MFHLCVIHMLTVSCDVANVVAPSTTAFWFLVSVSACVVTNHKSSKVGVRPKRRFVVAVAIFWNAGEVGGTHPLALQQQSFS